MKRKDEKTSALGTVDQESLIDVSSSKQVELDKLKAHLCNITR